MNRLLQALPGPRGPTEAISVGPTLPRILTGKAPVANLPLGPGAAQPMPIDRPELAAAFDRLYAGAEQPRPSLSRGPRRARRADRRPRPRAADRRRRRAPAVELCPVGRPSSPD